MSQVFYKIRDTRTGVTGYVPDFAWIRTRKLYQVMDIGDLAFMERADDVDYILQENNPEDISDEMITEVRAKPIELLTVGNLMDIIYNQIRNALEDFEDEACGNDDVLHGPAEKDSPKHVKG